MADVQHVEATIRPDHDTPLDPGLFAPVTQCAPVHNLELEICLMRREVLHGSSTTFSSKLVTGAPSLPKPPSACTFRFTVNIIAKNARKVQGGVQRLVEWSRNRGIIDATTNSRLSGRGYQVRERVGETRRGELDN